MCYNNSSIKKELFMFIKTSEWSHPSFNKGSNLGAMAGFILANATKSIVEVDGAVDAFGQPITHRAFTMSVCRVSKALGVVIKCKKSKAGTIFIRYMDGK